MSVTATVSETEKDFKYNSDITLTIMNTPVSLKWSEYMTDLQSTTEVKVLLPLHRHVWA